MQYLLNIVLFVVVLGAAAALVLSEVPALQVGGVILLPAFLLLCYAADWFAAWSNERHVEQRPDLLKNDAIGKRVRARGRFERRDGIAMGSVTLNGEQWKAYCPDHVPEDGELLTVQRREGLTLYVQSQDRDA